MTQKDDTRIVDALHRIMVAVNCIRERLAAAGAELVAAETGEASSTRTLTIADRIAAYAAPTPESIKRGDYAATRLVAAHARVSAEIAQERQQANVACAVSIGPRPPEPHFDMRSSRRRTGILVPPPSFNPRAAVHTPPRPVT